MTVEGIDNSFFNTGETHSSVVQFIISRATYDIHPDRRFAQHVAFTKGSGRIAGAYHFGTHGNASGQVDAFLATAKGVNLLALDLETNGADTMTNDEAALFLRLVHAKGHKIGLYHSQSGYPHLGQDWNWVARWGTTPPPSPWAFWQYAGTPLDRDRFNGSLAQLRVLAGLPVLPKYAVSIHPLEGMPGYPDYRYFNVFTVSGSVITAVSVARTGGFSASCTPPRSFVWPAHPSQSLVQLTSGSRAGSFVRAAWSHEQTV